MVDCKKQLHFFNSQSALLYSWLIRPANVFEPSTMTPPTKPDCHQLGRAADKAEYVVTKPLAKDSVAPRWIKHPNGSFTCHRPIRSTQLRLLDPRLAFYSWLEPHPCQAPQQQPVPMVQMVRPMAYPSQIQPLNEWSANRVKIYPEVMIVDFVPWVSGEDPCNV